MIKKLYVIYDLVSKSVFSPVMSADSDELMIREIRTAKLGEIIESNLEDFDLICVGSIDTTAHKIVDDTTTLVCHLEGIKTYGR